MSEKIEVEIFLMMDTDGDYAVGISEAEAIDLFKENVSASPALPVRIVKLNARMAPPAIEDGPTVDIPDTAGTTEQIEAEAA